MSLRANGHWMDGEMQAKEELDAHCYCVASGFGSRYPFSRRVGYG